MPPKIHCPVCEYEGKTSKTDRKGSSVVTIALLFFGIIPGILYEIWRGSSYYVCPKCKSQNINKITD